VRAMEEFEKVLDKQENERREYFNKIEKNANNFKLKIAEDVLKDMNNKNIDEESKMKNYLAEKEKRFIIFLF
jgi:hypothetical protein